MSAVCLSNHLSPRSEYLIICSYIITMQAMKCAAFLFSRPFNSASNSDCSEHRAAKFVFDISQYPNIEVMLLENSCMAFTIVIVSSIQFECLYAGGITWTAHRPLKA